jgi:hypothetical protein
VVVVVVEVDEADFVAAEAEASIASAVAKKKKGDNGDSEEEATSNQLSRMSSITPPKDGSSVPLFRLFAFILVCLVCGRWRESVRLHFGGSPLPSK